MVFAMFSVSNLFKNFCAFVLCCSLNSQNNAIWPYKDLMSCAVILWNLQVAMLSFETFSVSRLRKITASIILLIFV